MASTPTTESAPRTEGEKTTTTSPVIAEEEFKIKYPEPLYTEIPIKLPRLRTQNKCTKACANTKPFSTPPKTQTQTRTRAYTLSSLLPFRRRSIRASTSEEENTKEGKTQEEPLRLSHDSAISKEFHAILDTRLRQKHARSGAVDALAVVPTVLVLRAELFTPGEGKEKRHSDEG